MIAPSNLSNPTKHIGKERKAMSGANCCWMSHVSCSRMPFSRAYQCGQVTLSAMYRRSGYPAICSGVSPNAQIPFLSIR